MIEPQCYNPGTTERLQVKIPSHSDQTRFRSWLAGEPKENIERIEQNLDSLRCISPLGRLSNELDYREQYFGLT